MINHQSVLSSHIAFDMPMHSWYDNDHQKQAGATPLAVCVCVCFCESCSSTIYTGDYTSLQATFCMCHMGVLI